MRTLTTLVLIAVPALALVCFGLWTAPCLLAGDAPAADMHVLEPAQSSQAPAAAPAGNAGQQDVVDLKDWENTGKPAPKAPTRRPFSSPRHTPLSRAF